MASQIALAPAKTGSSIIKIPLIRQPLDTDTIKAAFGFIIPESNK